MHLSRWLRRSILTAILAAGATTTALAQAQPTPSDPQVMAQEKQFYPKVHSYVDYSQREIKKQLPDSGGLTFADSQDPLPSLLAKIGAKAEELAQKIPDLVSSEDVTQTKRIADEEFSSACINRLTGCSNEQSRHKEYNYLILVHRTPGASVFDEYRTNFKDKPVGQDEGGPMSYGFVSAWFVFFPANASESRFRYLGRQKVAGKNALVVAFAQTPGSVRMPGLYKFEGKSYPLLFQGIAWVDEKDSRILRLQTDLLAQIPEVALKQVTVDIQFHDVHVTDILSPLWLPWNVSVYWRGNGNVYEEVHHYSKYRKFRVESRIVVPAPASPTKPTQN
jgi:hypothetical protein